MDSKANLDKCVDVSNSRNKIRNKRHKTIFQLYVLSSISVISDSMTVQFHYYKHNKTTTKRSNCITTHLVGGSLVKFRQTSFIITVWAGPIIIGKTLQRDPEWNEDILHRAGRVDVLKVFCVLMSVVTLSLVTLSLSTIQPNCTDSAIHSSQLTVSIVRGCRFNPSSFLNPKQ